MKILGVALVVLGVVALVYGGFSYKRERTVLDVGGLRATATENKTFPLSPLVGGIAVAAGLVLVFIPYRRSA